MDEDKIRKLVSQELKKFKQAQAKVDARQRERIQQLAGMKKKMTRDACSSLGMMTMADFMGLMSKLKAAEKGQYGQTNEDKLIEEDEDELVDLSGVLNDEQDHPLPGGRGEPDEGM